METEPGPSSLRVSNESIQFRGDVDGCDVPAAWQLCVYFQHGLDAEARIVPDGTRAAHRDGSLLMATPEEGDRIVLEHVHKSPEVGILELRSGGYAVKALAGEPPRYTLTLECPTWERRRRRGRGLPDPRRAAARGRLRMVSVDVVAEGKALWSAGTAIPSR